MRTSVACEPYPTGTARVKPFVSGNGLRRDSAARTVNPMGRDRQPDEITTAVGARLKAIRLSRGLSQERLRDLSGVPAPTISRIEAGILWPSTGMWQKLAEALGVSWIAFVLPDREADAQHLLELCGRVTREQLGTIIRLLTDLAKKS